MTAVLGHIDSLADLIRCSAVSKSWRSAYYMLRPTSLEVPGRPTGAAGFDSILQWLQRKQRQHYFSNLRNLSLLLDNSEYKFENLDMLGAVGLAILMLAGLWPLHVCKVDGPFELEQGVLLLPPTLHHFEADIDPTRYFSPEVDISIFQRFTQLESLQLRALISCEESGEPTGYTMLSPAPLLKLKHLHLSPWPFHDNGRLATSLPSMTHAALHVHASDLQRYVKLQGIEYLSLQLVNCEFEAAQVQVEVIDESSLNCFVLSAPENVKVDICLKKSGLLFDFRGSSGIRSVCSPGNLGRQHQLPKHFRGLCF